ncbi:MAG TPA: hypothetical protein VGJ84_22630 [Polyangiaceae bacterium]|jgi:hypothetical protein
MPTSFNKRQKELNRVEQQRAKEERRRQRRAERTARVPNTSGEDPDIAAIVPGPQPDREDPR